MKRSISPPLASLLKQHRVNHGLTQEALAERAGISVRTIKGIEQGDRHMPRADTLERVVTALQLSPDDEVALREAARGTHDPSADAVAALPPAVFLDGAGLLTPLFGRDDVIRDAIALLFDDAASLVTLIGPPGVGKTRIGLEIAQRIASAPETYATRVVCIALASLRQPEFVISTIAHAVGIVETQGQQPLDALSATFRGERTLLFLDNCEHLLAATGALVALLTRCPNAKMLLTSRAALRVRGERELPIPPLPVVPPRPMPTHEGIRLAIMDGPIPRVYDTAHASPVAAAVRQAPAVALFVERARATQPGFELNDSNVAAIVEICRQVDGLPLAIELAAARSRLFPPAALLERLTNRLTLLADRAPDLPPRQRTMRDAIAWSYQLLSTSEQRLFRHLGVFANSCSLEAVEAVCAQADVDTPMLDDLTSLVAHSLVHRSERPSGAITITMLETIRAYAQEQLDACGERAAAERAHSAYYCALADAMVEHSQTQPPRFDLTLPHDEYANFQVALGWVVDQREVAMGERLIAGLWRYWYTRGILAEGRQWAESLLALVGDTDRRWIETGLVTDIAPEVSARAGTLAVALNGVGMLAYRQGDHSTAMDWLRRSLALNRWREDKRGIAAILNNLGIVAAEQGANAEAQALHEESLTLKRELGSPYDIAISLNNLGIVARALGHYTEATNYFEENLAIQRERGDTYRIAHALGNLGTQAFVQSEYGLAYARFQECLTLQHELGDIEGIATTTLNLGEVARAQGAFAQAVVLGEESRSIFRALGEPLRVASACSLLASASLAQGDPRAGCRYLQDTLDLYRSLGRHRTSHLWSAMLARLATNIGLYIAAAQFLAAAEALRQTNGTVWSPAEQQEIKQLAEQVRQMVKPSAFRKAWETATAWSWSDLLTTAQDCLARPVCSLPTGAGA